MPVSLRVTRRKVQQGPSAFGRCQSEEPARAGGKLAAVLRAAGVTGALTDAQSAQAVDSVLTELASQGIAATTAQALLGSALAPVAIDVLAVLGQP